MQGYPQFLFGVQQPLLLFPRSHKLRKNTFVLVRFSDHHKMRRTYAQCQTDAITI